MDLDYLQNALDNIQLKYELIHSIAEYCIVNNVNSELDISNMIINHFNNHKEIKIKTAFFILIGEIFLLANIKKNKLFFKYLAGKICPFIQLLKRDVMENMQLAIHLTMIVDKWKVEEIFSQSFTEKIMDICQPIYNKINDQKAGGGKHQKFMKYKKTFLMQLYDIRKFEPTSLIYDTYAQMHEMNMKLNSFQLAYNKIDFENPNEETLKRGAELQRAIEDYKQKLQGIISGHHLGYKKLMEECKNDLSKLQGRNE